jgi:deoxyribonuclease V
MQHNNLKEEQIRLAKKIIRTDDLGSIETIAGCDITYSHDKAIYSICVLDYNTFEIKEARFKIIAPSFPYVPTFLGYRETPGMVELYSELENEPDLLIVLGNGILHPRNLGLASHLGLLLDKPTIGVSKKLLCGDINGEEIIKNKEILGKIFHTKENAKQIFISPGHRISLKTSIEIIKRCLKGHKMPEPLHQAHKFASKQKNKARTVLLENKNN